MNGVLKAAVVLLPLGLLFFGLRACSGGAGERWRARVAVVDSAARLAVDRADLVVVAPDVEWGATAGATVERFYESLRGGYSDLLGPGSDQRKVVVLFSRIESLREFAGQRSPFRDTSLLHGYMDPSLGALFLPPGSELSTLRHETVHLYMAQGHRQTVRYSPFVLEGLAQAFERFDPDAAPPRGPGIDRGDYAVPDAGRLLAIQAYEEFLGPQVLRNYGDAHVLCAYLLTAQPREKLAAYVARERATEIHRGEEFRAIYDHEGDAFREGLRAFVSGLR